MSRMLDDGLDFVKDDPSQKQKRNKSPWDKDDKNAKKSNLNLDLNQSQITSTSQVNIAEKIRGQKEAEDAKKKKFEEFLAKQRAKKGDINKFLKRELDFEQKRQYDISVLKNKIKEKERLEIQECPKMTEASIKITEKQNYKPLYTRTEQIIQERLNTINYGKERYTLPLNTINTTCTNYRNDMKSFTSRTKTKRKGRNTKRNNSVDIIKTTEERNEESDQKDINERINTWLIQQDEWNSKMKTKKIEYMKTLEENDISKKEYTYQPKISHYINKKIKAQQIYERLYKTSEESKIQKEMLTIQAAPTFSPEIFKNPKFKKIASKYCNCSVKRGRSGKDKDDELNSKNEIKNKKKKITKSVDKNCRTKKVKGPVDIMTIGKVRKSGSSEHWSNLIIKVSNTDKKTGGQPKEMGYKLNVMPSTAWNENMINSVPGQGEAKNIIKAFL